MTLADEWDKVESLLEQAVELLMTDYRKPDAYGPPQFRADPWDDAAALRAENERLKEQNKVQANLIASWRSEAETLRAENERLREANVKFSDQCAIHDAEVNRLREALEKIVDGQEGSGYWMVNIARAALSQSEKPYKRAVP
jgi:uncharacterized protein YukE